MGRRRSQVGSESRLLQHTPLAVVTRAFGYTGRKVARRLLGEGIVIRTLTRNPGREYPFGGRLLWTSPARRGCGGRRRTTFEQSVENSRVLFEAAVGAGVEGIVHFPVANASSECPLPYFRGKGHVEEILK